MRLRSLSNGKKWMSAALISCASILIFAALATRLRDVSFISIVLSDSQLTILAGLGLAIFNTLIARIFLGGEKRSNSESFEEHSKQSRKNTPAAKQSRANSLFGSGKVSYSLDCLPEETLKITVRAVGLSKRQFKEQLLPLLEKMGGVRWEHPKNLSAYQQREQLIALKKRLAAGPPSAPVITVRTVSGATNGKRPVQEVRRDLESLLGTPQLAQTAH